MGELMLVTTQTNILTLKSRSANGVPAILILRAFDGKVYQSDEMRYLGGPTITVNDCRTAADRLIVGDPVEAYCAEIGAQGFIAYINNIGVVAIVGAHECYMEVMIGGKQ